MIRQISRVKTDLLNGRIYPGELFLTKLYGQTQLSRSWLRLHKLFLGQMTIFKFSKNQSIDPHSQIGIDLCSAMWVQELQQCRNQEQVF